MSAGDGGLNIGIARPRVVFLTKSPFGGQAKQEYFHVFTEDTFTQLKEKRNVFAGPSPVNGIRLTEEVKAYDNFLEDANGTRLEDAFKEQAESESSQQKQSDPLAAARARIVSLADISEEQKNFFTWKIDKNLFVEDPDTNPPPVLFTAQDADQRAQANSNSPEWTYAALSRPGNNQKALMLTPFMMKNFPDNTKPVHWGLTTKSEIAKNQPFEILFYMKQRDANIADKAEPLVSLLNFVEKDGEEDRPLRDLDLTKALYVAIEIGKNSANNHLLFLFKNDTEPMLFSVEGGNGDLSNAVLIDKFSGFNSRKLFDENHRPIFTISFESVLGSLIVRSNVFSEIPWIIKGNINTPLGIEQSHVSIYGGNTNAGVAMRPIQYAPEGGFKTTEMTFNFIDDSDDPQTPGVTTALKGAGEIEQVRSKVEASDRDANNKGRPQDEDEKSKKADAEVHAVDSERVNGENVRTVLAADETEAAKGTSIQRDIKLEIEEVEVRDTADVAELTISTKVYRALVDLVPSDVSQPSGYVVENGRSPYVFMVRCELPAKPAEPEGEALDVSCDVMDIDLSWNATSYQELQHTGTIRLLNGPRNVSGIDYRTYSNRAVYLRIFSHWENGVGEKEEKAIFTGLTVSTSVETVAEREIVSLKVEDYMSVLQGSKFILSPFYDGMKSSLAVRDIVLQTGLEDSRILVNDTPVAEANLENDFGLPLANPFEANSEFRFKDGSSYKEAILKIARIQFRTIYFDGDGNFHYETMAGGDPIANQDFQIKAKFWSQLAAAGDAPSNAQAWNMVSFTRMINDVYNVFQIETVDKFLLAKISVGTAYKSGIFDPGAEGYIGYRKHFLQQEASIGTVDGVFSLLDRYRRSFVSPPLTGRFEIYGTSKIKPLDIIQLDGQLLRIMNISSKLSAAENTYYQNVEGEWIFAAGSAKDQAPEVTPTSATSSQGSSAGASSTK